MTLDWLSYLDKKSDRFLEDFLELLRIPSVSTQPENKIGVRRAAGWVAERLRQAGIEGVAVMETAGHPVVYGEWGHAPGKPTVLFYGHFDVQPCDNQGWDSSPFEPVVHDGRVYARGASDMKGNLLLPLYACEALLRAEGVLPVNVKFLCEGEEEIGSPSLAPFVTSHRDLLECDLVVSGDSAQHGEEQPSLMVGLRGVCGLQIDVRSAATDMHSGLLGGIVPNALHALVRILDSMRSPEGRILVDGFYDEVLPLSPAEREAMAGIPDNRAEIVRQTGIKKTVGEPGFTTRERNWARPTLEVNGIWGGYIGEGVKTVIPREAHAKITCRLVPEQSPRQVLDLLQAHIARYAPPEVDVEVSPFPGRSDPYLIPLDHPGILAAQRALTLLYRKQPYYTRFGATIPATAIFLQELGAYTIQFGFGMEDERQHAANEFVRLGNLMKGQRAFGMLLRELEGLRQGKKL